MTTIVQICPEIGPGSGVGGVAFHLEKEWRARGVRVERFTLEDVIGRGLTARTHVRPGLPGKLLLLFRVVSFSTLGTVLARRRLGSRRDVLTICHNDALFGDVYVNHGIVQAAMRARGGYWWRMARNPLHLFTTARDKLRYAGWAGHGLVVNLVTGEEVVLRRTYPRLAVDTVVIGNGVDVSRFELPSEEVRNSARRRLGISPGDHVLLFVGHEFNRKGLPILLSALERLPLSTHLVVVGGGSDQIATASRSIPREDVRRRVHFVGVQSDPRMYFHAADAFVLPSAYESHALVILESLACGLPVIATATGSAPDLIRQGENGYIIRAEPGEVVRAVTALRAVPADLLRESARATAQKHSWEAVAQTYLEVLEHHFGRAIRNAR